MATTKGPKEPRAQHYVSNFYLEGFTDPEKTTKTPRLWVYEKGRPPRPSTPRNECHYRDFYTYDAGREKKFDFEHALGRFESEAAECFWRVEGNGYRFSPKDRQIMSYFVALMFARVPAYRDFARTKFQSLLDQICQPDELSRFAQEMSQELSKPVAPGALRALLMSDAFKPGKHDALYLDWIVRGAERLAPILAGMNWKVAESTGEAFVTSDNPIVTRRDDKSGRVFLGEGFGNPSVYVYFPLNRQACLVMSRDSFEVNSDGAAVRDVNKTLMRVAKRYLYASRLSSNLDRVFQKIGCEVTYGKNALM